MVGMDTGEVSQVQGKAQDLSGGLVVSTPAQEEAGSLEQSRLPVSFWSGSMAGMENENQDQPVIQPGAKGVQRQPKGAKKRLGGAGRPKPTKPETWSEIRRASEQGVTDKELERTFGVTRNAIRQHRHREGWVSLMRLEDKIQSMRLATTGAKTEGDGMESGGMVALVAGSLLERGQKYSLRMFDFASKQAEKAMIDDFEAADTWKKLQIADTLARRAAGLDKNDDKTSVSVNLAMFTAQKSGGETGWTVAESQV